MWAAEPPCRQSHPNTAAMGRDIRETSFVSTVNPLGEAPTFRTFRVAADGMGRDDHLIRPDRNVIHDKAGRQQPVSLPSFRHEQLPIATSCDKSTDMPHPLHRD